MNTIEKDILKVLISEAELKARVRGDRRADRNGL